MPIVFSGLTPHPPLLIPEVGKENLKEVTVSRTGLQSFARELVSHAPETLVIITPHGPVFQDAVSVYTLEEFSGDFRRFGARTVEVKVRGSLDLAQRIIEEARKSKVPVLEINASTMSKYGISPLLDHATMVPLWYFLQARLNASIVLVSMGFLTYRELFDFGKCIQRAVEQDGRPIAVVASGDLSHRLIPSAPAGYDPIGKVFDQKVLDLLKVLDAQGILQMEEDLIERAGECGFRPICIMLGALEGLPASAHLLSYEGPFGVGYGVVAIEIGEGTESPMPADALPLRKRRRGRRPGGVEDPEDPEDPAKGGAAEGRAAKGGTRDG